MKPQCPSGPSIQPTLFDPFTLKTLKEAKFYISHYRPLFLSPRQSTAEVRSPGTREDCDLSMHALAAEALQSPSADRLQRDGDDGDLCSAPLDVEGRVVELELLPAGRESREGLPGENAAEDGRCTAETEVSQVKRCLHDPR